MRDRLRPITTWFVLGTALLWLLSELLDFLSQEDRGRLGVEIVLWA